MAIDPTSLTALLISLIALLATMGQLLQQYIATADGWRYCQDSVMGPFWGSKTKPRWRWREFRFETIYFVPKLSIIPLYECELIKAPIWDERYGANRMEVGSLYKLTGDSDQLPTQPVQMESKVMSKETTEDIGEKVCWVDLIDHLQQIETAIKCIYPDFDEYPKGRREAKSPTATNLVRPPFVEHRTNSIPKGLPKGVLGAAWTDTTVPCIRVCQRSWDFMGGDIARPFCLSTLSDVVSIVFRLGMRWKEFDPGNRKLTAEGSGHMLTSRSVHSIGLCLEYTSTGPSTQLECNDRDRIDRIYLPIDAILDLAFGVVPGNKALHCWDRSIGSIFNITDGLKFLDNLGQRSLRLSEALLEVTEGDSGWLPGINDLIPLTAPKFSRNSTLMCNIPMPNAFSPGLLRTQLGLRIFLLRLEAYIVNDSSPSLYLKQVQVLIKGLEAIPCWTSHQSAWAYISPFSTAADLKKCSEERAIVHQALDTVEGYLVEINKDPTGSVNGDTTEGRKGFCYDTLLVEHIRMVVPIHKTHLIGIRVDINHTSKEKKKSELKDSSMNWLEAIMNAYWDGLPALVEQVARYTGCEKKLAADAWIMMIFRAFLWHHCHRLIKQNMVLPAEWHRSQMPVYIG